MCLFLNLILACQDLPEEPEEVTHVSVTYTSKKGERIEFGFDKEVLIGADTLGKLPLTQCFIPLCGINATTRIMHAQVDRTQIFIPELIEDYSLDADEFDPVKACLKEAFVSARAAKAEQLAKQRQSLDEMGPTARAALDAMHILKYVNRQLFAYFSLLTRNSLLLQLYCTQSCCSFQIICTCVCQLNCA